LPDLHVNPRSVMPRWGCFTLKNTNYGITKDDWTKLGKTNKKD